LPPNTPSHSAPPALRDLKKSLLEIVAAVDKFLEETEAENADGDAQPER
jgi:hypothetical protein